MDISLKDACTHCENYDTCKAPCYFAAALADNAIKVSLTGGSKIKDYNNLNQTEETKFSDGRYYCMSSIEEEDGLVNYIDNIPDEDAGNCIEDVLEFEEITQADDIGTRVFLDTLRHGRNLKRTAANLGIEYSTARGAFYSTIGKIKKVLELAGKYVKPFKALEQYSIPKEMKVYLASQLFEEMPTKMLCEMLEIDHNYYAKLRKRVEQQMEAGNVVFYHNGIEYIPATVTNYLKYLRTLPDYRKPVSELFQSRRSISEERKKEALKLVAQGMSLTKAANLTGVGRHKIAEAVKAA